MGKILGFIAWSLLVSIMAFSQGKVDLTPEEGPDGQLIYRVVEEMPQYPGGKAELSKYLAVTPYPKEAKAQFMHGKVYIQFIIGKDGVLRDFKVSQSSGHQLLDSVALAHVSAMPSWSPGKQNGETVEVKFVIPLKFRLDDELIANDVDTEPVFRGGKPALDKYLASAVVPDLKNYKGTANNVVRVEVVIGIEGYVTSTRVIASSGNAEIDKAAEEHLKDMPQWIPATKNRMKVAVTRVFEVRFQ